MAEVVLDRVSKIYDSKHNAVAAVDAVSLHVNDGEFLVLVGPSGCGKSTLLRMIAGLEEISSGNISIGDRRCNDIAPKDRDIAMVFQNYALYPHMTVEENMAFGLKIAKVPREQVSNRVREAAELLGLDPYLARKPKELSGGQRQRVALGRAIVRKPEVFLFDEPLSNLDAKMRVQMRVEISRIAATLKTTVIYVTHDQTEAMTMGDRIVCMCWGKVQQVGTPLELYSRPVNRFVAGFVGVPPMNFIHCEVSGSAVRLQGSDCVLTVDPSKLAHSPGFKDGRRTMGVRPEAFTIVNDGLTSGLRVRVELVERLGSETLVHCRAGKEAVVARFDPQIPVSRNDAITLFPLEKGMHFFDE